MRQPTKSKTGQVYQLKISLRNIRPPIWRRVQVYSDITLDELHKVIQIVMGWTESHLHQFEIGETDYSIPSVLEGPFGEKPKDERRAKLSKVAPQEKSKFGYLYDFGDSWEHEILVEKILPAAEGQYYPVCLTGKRAGPPDDCGGPWGYADFVEAIKDPKHPDHEDLLEWIGGEFDPEAFDLEDINKRLEKIDEWWSLMEELE
jgi:hypothetical protein